MRAAVNAREHNFILFGIINIFIFKIEGNAVHRDAVFVDESVTRNVTRGEEPSPEVHLLP